MDGNQIHIIHPRIKLIRDDEIWKKRITMIRPTLTVYFYLLGNLYVVFCSEHRGNGDHNTLICNCWSTGLSLTLLWRWFYCSSMWYFFYNAESLLEHESWAPRKSESKLLMADCFMIGLCKMFAPYHNTIAVHYENKNYPTLLLAISCHDVSKEISILFDSKCRLTQLQFL